MAISGSTILIAGLVAAAVAAASAGAQMYMQSEAQAAQASQQRKMAEWQQQAEADQAEAARKQVRLRAQRYLNAQASKAGGAGVVAGEGSLLVNQLEAASLRTQVRIGTAAAPSPAAQRPAMRGQPR